MKNQAVFAISILALFYAGCGSDDLPAPGGALSVSTSPGPTPTVTVTVLPAPSIAYGFTVSGPSYGTSGQLLSFTVTALDSGGNLNTSYQGTIQLSSSDPTASLPPPLKLYGGSGVVTPRFYAGGPQTLTVVDVDNYQAMGTSIPTAIAGPQISTDGDTCAISATGTSLYCWGQVHDLALDGSANQYSVPTLHSLASLPNTGNPDPVPNSLAGLSVGAYPAASFVLSSSGNVWGWGDDTYGQLGDAGAAGGTPPTIVEIPGAGGTSTLKNIVQISSAPAFPVSGGGHPVGSISGGYACALSLSGNVYCWGANDYGQIGNGQAVASNGGGSPLSKPTEVLGGAQGGTYLSGVVAIATASFAACAVTSSGNVYCWGTQPQFGSSIAWQLGNNQGGSTHSYTPTEVVGVGGTGFLSLITGISMSHTGACATSVLGNVYCWGPNNFGEAGIGADPRQGDGTMTASQPYQVLGIGGTDYLSGAAATFASGDDNDPGVCATTSGANLICWGREISGELGIGVQVGYPALPTEVLGGQQGGANLSNVAGLSVGYQMDCAIAKQSGIYGVYCWGTDANGTLGSNGWDINSTTGATTPVNHHSYSWAPVLACSASTTNDDATACGGYLQL